MAFGNLFWPKARGLRRSLFASVAVCALAGLSSIQPVHAQGKLDLSLTLVANVYSIEVRAGKDTRMVLEVRNTATEPVTAIRLSAEAPAGWMVVFDPDQIARIDPGLARAVNIDVRPASTVTRGEYYVTLIATAEGIQRMQSFQVSVKPASYWLWVVFGVAAIAVVVFVFVFMKVGRRG